MTQELVDDHVYGLESQIEVDRFLLQAEYARGRTLGETRSGYYVQPAVRLRENWTTFYRIEQLDSPRIQRAERRHLAGLNFRPYRADRGQGGVLPRGAAGAVVHLIGRGRARPSMASRRRPSSFSKRLWVFTRGSAAFWFVAALVVLPLGLDRSAACAAA